MNWFVAVLGWLLIAVGLFEIFHNMEENKCEMTYMFQYPEYIPILLQPDLKKKFPKYSLVMYGEGLYADSLRNYGPSGIPVLFIPGNAGSHKQVRSLGSVALRKTEHLGYHFNYFAVDFKEELSALKGSYLKSQTAFVHQCLKLILNLYTKNEKHRHSVVLIGHSMGGIIARGLFMLNDFNPDSVNTIITLATPNLKPVLNVDHEMQDYYSNLNKFWNEPISNASLRASLMHLVVLSIGGGNRDIQVRSDLTSLGPSFLSNQSIAVIASAVPKVWLSTDHRCIVWCKQLILAITRSLIDMVDESTFQIKKDQGLRLEALKYHFVSALSNENSIKKVKMALNSKHNLIDLSKCRVIENSYFSKSAPQKTTCFLMMLKEQSGELVALYDGNTIDWIGLCKDTQRCQSYKSLANKAVIMPSRSNQRKAISMQINELLKDGDYVLFRMSHSSTERLHIVVNPNSYLLDRPLIFDSVTKSSGNQRTLSRLRLPFLQFPWEVYLLNVNGSCRKSKPSITLHFHVPWMSEDVFKVFEASTKLQLKFNSLPPMSLISRLVDFITKKFSLPSWQFGAANNAHEGSEFPEVIFWHDSKCNFTYNISFDLTGTTGQLLKFSYTSLLEWLTALTLVWLVAEMSPTNLKLILSAVTCTIVIPLTCFMILWIGEGILISSKIVISHSIFILIIHISKVLTFVLKAIANLVHLPSHARTLEPLWLLAAFFLTPILLSLFVSGGVGICSYIVALCIRVITKSRTHSWEMHCSFVMLLLNFGSLVSWTKELEFEVRIDSDMSNWRCAAFIALMYLYSFVEDKSRFESITHIMTLLLFSSLIILQLDIINRTDDLFFGGLLMHYLFVKGM